MPLQKYTNFSSACRDALITPILSCAQKEQSNCINTPVHVHYLWSRVVAVSKRGAIGIESQNSKCECLWQQRHRRRLFYCGESQCFECLGNILNKWTLPQTTKQYFLQISSAMWVIFQTCLRCGSKMSSWSCAESSVLYISTRNGENCILYLIGPCETLTDWSGRVLVARATLNMLCGFSQKTHSEW